MKLILNRTNQYHVSLDTVHEFEQTIRSDPQVEAAKPARALSVRLSFAIWRLLKKYRFLLPPGTGTPFKTRRSSERCVFSVVMAPNFRQCFPYFMTTARKAIYLFDAWPSEHEVIARFVTLLDVQNVFVSSRQAADMLQSKVLTTRFHWLPEGIRPEDYKQYPYASKDIDVIALGRKYDAYHELIVAHLANTHRTYLYEKAKGAIIFPGREEFVDGLARSKISICVPSSITHPTRAGGIETMTIRYLQSMISKCLIVGKAPEELTSLFGYNPVIEIDSDNPAGQIQSVLENFSAYVPLIEKNFSAVLNQHTWNHRWEKARHMLLP